MGRDWWGSAPGTALATRRWLLLLVAVDVDVRVPAGFAVRLQHVGAGGHPGVTRAEGVELADGLDPRVVTQRGHEVAVPLGLRPLVLRVGDGAVLGQHDRLVVEAVA